MNYALQGDAAWDTAFLAGLAEALQTHGMPLIGGDTVSLPKGAPGVFTLTAIGEAPASGAPARNGAQEGDVLYVTGTVGDAGLGLALAQRGIMEPASAIRAYRRPQPRLAEGRRSEEHTSELQSLMRISYAVFCLKKKKNITE